MCICCSFWLISSFVLNRCLSVNYCMEYLFCYLFKIHSCDEDSRLKEHSNTLSKYA